ncbi:murein L,D-transpeptidase catalytic domain family protein [Chryseobacterium sp. A301]
MTKKILLSLVSVLALSTSYKSSDSAKSVSTKEAKSDTSAYVALPEVNVEKSSLSQIVLSSYNRLDFSKANELSFEVFEKAMTGFENLKKAGEIKEETVLLTVLDFSKSSNEKRLWVINTKTGAILFNALVAHGKNTGEEFAQNFSNTESSLQSSLGFYRTDLTYQGGNGYSLKLHGLDKGYNDAAFRRAIVMHGANYVNENFAKQHKRIGRSWGCPAVSTELAKPIINTIKDGSVLFIYYPDQSYLNETRWLKS